MKLTVVMVTTYIIECFMIGTKPCKYFQLNSPHFNNEKGVFSKIDLDRLIPDKWRLAQRYDDDAYFPETYPVFLKPEWGENASGIFRADDRESLIEIRAKTKNSRVPYIIQQGAREANEYEIFGLRHHKDKNQHCIFSVTLVKNELETNPINSIHNPGTRYHEITDDLSDSQKQTLWDLMGQIGRFGIFRISVRSDSVDDLLEGRFHVIELNLFNPMPIHLLDRKYSKWDLWKINLKYMYLLARVTKYRDKSLKEYPIYTKIRFYNRENKFVNLVRERL